MTLTTLSAVTILSGAILAGLAGPALAAATPVGRNPAKIAEAGPAPAADDDATCNTSRKRLWVEGEGWIVRRVTICR